MKQYDEKKIMIIPKDLIAGGDDSKRLCIEVVTLKHPFSGDGCKFLLPTGSSGNVVYEIRTQKEKLASWFLGETVKEDGAMYICSKFDPLYMILPYLMKACSNGKFVLLDQVLKDEDYPDCAKLLKSCSNEDILNIADQSGSGDFIGFKYNQEKTLSWLTLKINGIKKALGTSGLFISASDEDDKENEDIHLEYAFGILSNYIPSEIANLLQTHLNIRKKPDKRQAHDALTRPQSKKIKTENAMTEKSKKQPKMSRAQRELSKVDKKGMKSISSFFAAKKK